jgi:hypothetical protein
MRGTGTRRIQDGRYVAAANRVCRIEMPVARVGLHYDRPFVCSDEGDVERLVN